MDYLTNYGFYKEEVKYIPGYKNMTIQEIVDNYCEATDRDLMTRDLYFAGIMLKFWNTINKIINHVSVLGIDADDCFCRICTELIDILNKRAWIEKNIKAEQVINQALMTRVDRAYFYEANLQKNKDGFNMASLDCPLGSDEDGHETTLGDLIPATESITFEESLQLIQDLCIQKKLIDAMILDIIATTDPFEHTSKVIKTEDGRKYTKNETVFKRQKVREAISELDDNYLTRFTNKYTVNDKEITAAFNALRDAKNTKKYAYIDKTLASLKEVRAIG